MAENNIALNIAMKELEAAQLRVVMLKEVAGLKVEKEKALAEREDAWEKVDEAQTELAKLNSQIGKLQAEVNLAVEHQSARIEDEQKRVLAPLQKVKDDLRAMRAKAQVEKESLSRQINDLAATKAGLEGTLNKLESNIRARDHEWKALEAEMLRSRNAFTEEKRGMERERASLGDTDQIKEELRLTHAAAIREKEEIAREVREMRVVKTQVEKELKEANDNLAERKRKNEAEEKAALKTRDQYSTEKHEMERDLENLKNQKINLQRQNARLGKDEAARA